VEAKPFVLSPSFDFAQDIREKPFALRFSKGRTVRSGQALSKHEGRDDAPFDRLRVSGDILRSYNFSGHAELVEA
jgi:hypothetical protein